jgi:DNA-binding response OmpR family regulator
MSISKFNTKAKILKIDDDSDINNFFKIYLESNGYNVDAYTNPLDALHNFRKNSHDFIILNLKMPKMDGMTLYRKIKEIDDKVIICITTTNKNYSEDLRKGHYRY